MILCVYLKRQMEKDGVGKRESETDRQSEGKRERCRGRRFVGVKKLIVFIGTDGQI